MFNNHNEIVKIVEDALMEIEDNGHFDPQSSLNIVEETTSIVRERLEYMQSQIDELMLEYCPEDMSDEQLDNWAKNQRALSKEECDEMDKNAH